MSTPAAATELRANDVFTMMATVLQVRDSFLTLQVRDMKSFTIKIKEPAEKRLRRFNKNIQNYFAIEIRKLKENPDIHGKPLRGSLHCYWELYFENKFRILYTIDHNEKVVIIEAIRHKNEF